MREYENLWDVDEAIDFFEENYPTPTVKRV